jgi:hypothetical protein
VGEWEVHVTAWMNGNRDDMWKIFYVSDDGIITPPTTPRPPTPTPDWTPPPGWGGGLDDVNDGITDINDSLRQWRNDGSTAMLNLNNALLLSEIASTLGFVRDLFDRVLFNMGTVLILIILLPMSLALAMLIIGMGVRQYRKINISSFRAGSNKKGK